MNIMNSNYNKQNCSRQPLNQCSQLRLKAAKRKLQSWQAFKAKRFNNMGNAVSAGALRKQNNNWSSLHIVVLYSLASFIWHVSPTKYNRSWQQLRKLLRKGWRSRSRKPLRSPSSTVAREHFRSLRGPTSRPTWLKSTTTLQPLTQSGHNNTWMFW